MSARDAVAVAELCRLAVARLVSEALCLSQRIRAAVDVVETVDERAHQAEKRIGPVGAQFGRLSKRGDGFGEFRFASAVSFCALRASPLMRCRCPSQ